MAQGCFYCGNIATTIDRIDSTLDHTPDNCVGCCYPCNTSKGAADPATFIRKAYYRARGKYVDDITHIWSINAMIPSMYGYKTSALKKGVSFNLVKKDFNDLINGDCKYCKRSPTTWFGIDRVIPSQGYVIDNIVTCCFDCNIDKHEVDVETTMKRNTRIADRVDTGELVIKVCPQMILHQGTQKASKKVCAYGKVYASKSDASRALGKSDSYVAKCIKKGIHSDDIFEITDDFYEEVIKSTRVK